MNQYTWEFWWVLQQIKRKLIKENPKNNTVSYPIYMLENEPAIPSFSTQEKIIAELRNKSIINANLMPPTGTITIIGMDEYSIRVIQPQFEELLKSVESQVLKKNIDDYASLFEYFDESLKSKIEEIIATVLQKYHMLMAMSDKSNTLEDFKIPKADFTTKGITTDDIEKVFTLLSKNVGFTSYFKESKGENVHIVFSPSLSSTEAINILKEIKQMLLTPNKEATNSESTNSTQLRSIQLPNLRERQRELKGLAKIKEFTKKETDFLLFLVDMKPKDKKKEIELHLNTKECKYIKEDVAKKLKGTDWRIKTTQGGGYKPTFYQLIYLPSQQL